MEHTNYQPRPPTKSKPPTRFQFGLRFVFMEEQNTEKNENKKYIFIGSIYLYWFYIFTFVFDTLAVPKTRSLRTPTVPKNKNSVQMLFSTLVR